jgi:hypothetical protein
VRLAAGWTSQYDGYDTSTRSFLSADAGTTGPRFRGEGREDAASQRSINPPGDRPQSPQTQTRRPASHVLEAAPLPCRHLRPTHGRSLAPVEVPGPTLRLGREAGSEQVATAVLMIEWSCSRRRVGVAGHVAFPSTAASTFRSISASSAAANSPARSRPTTPPTTRKLTAAQLSPRTPSGSGRAQSDSPPRAAGRSPAGSRCPPRTHPVDPARHLVVRHGVPRARRPATP